MIVLTIINYHRDYHAPFDQGLSSVIQYVTCSKREDLVRLYQREQFFTSLAPATGMTAPAFHILRIVIVMSTELLESFAKCFGR